MPELSLFLGKGGVGKTTVSAAFAVHRALQNPKKRVLLISTDPAHSLADILQEKLSSVPTAVRLSSSTRLQAWQINPEKRFGAFVTQHKKALLSAIEQGTPFTRREIEPLLDTALPGMAEMASLLGIHDAVASGRYDEIVVDTAPFGHTLRLFELPAHFSRFLDFVEVAGSRDAILAEHFGGRPQPAPAFLQNWRDVVESLSAIFRQNARLFAVTTPEKFALNETVRCLRVLRSSPDRLQIHALVLNRAVAHPGKCIYCRQRASATHSAHGFLSRQFPKAEQFVGEDSGVPVLGVTSLIQFAQHVFAKKPLRLKAAPQLAPELKLRRVSWPQTNPQLSLITGKGGVGKTTFAAGLTYEARKRGAVALCSVDPAPSLDDVFLQEIGDQPQPVFGDANLTASEMDAAANFRHWVEGVREKINQALSMETSGLRVDLSFERQLFSALLDVVPPGIDEVFAVFRILDMLSARSQVIIDMAPTGHALELLRMPERMLAWARLLLKTLSAHRKLALAQDVGAQVAAVGQEVRELLAWLKGSGRAQIWIVMLPEALPDRETERLLTSLTRLRLPIGPVVINRVLFPEDAKGCARCTKARRWQLATIARVSRSHYGSEVYIVRNFPSEVAGRRALQAFTRHLWQIA